MTPSEIIPYWNTAATSALVGRTIMQVRNLSSGELTGLGWFRTTQLVALSDNTLLFPSMDDEGNGSGVWFSCDAKGRVSPLTTPAARKALMGRTITKTTYMNKGWNNLVVVIELDNGVSLFPGRDAEGNDGGAVFGQGPTNEDISLPAINSRYL